MIAWGFLSVAPQRIVCFLPDSLSFICKPLHGWAPTNLADYVVFFEGPDFHSSFNMGLIHLIANDVGQGGSMGEEERWLTLISFTVYPV